MFPSMKSHITRDIKGCSASGIQTILTIYNALNILSFWHRPEGLPENFDDIPTVKIYDAPGKKGDDWMAHLNGQGQAWIITPLYYNDGGSNAIRSASGGGRWHARDRQLKNHEGASWFERKYKLVERTNKQQATKEGAGLPKCTMVEYSPDEIKPTHALCQITVHNESNASSQQREGKEIDHTDSNNRDKRKTSLSQESMHHGGNFENATRYCNQSNLEMFFARIIQGGELSEFMKHFSKDDIVQVFSRKMDEKPAASPKEHSTEAAVMNPKHSHGTNMKTIREADVSTQRQKQAKVEVMVLEQNADLQDPHNISHNFTANVTEPTENRFLLPNYNQNIIAPGPTPSYCETNVPPITDQCPYNPFEEQHFSLRNTQHGQMFEPNANVEEPNNLSLHFTANSTEPMESSNHLQVFSVEMDEIEIPDASPKEHSTEAAVRNLRKLGRFTYTNTMEEGTITQGQEQVKVEMSESNSYGEKPTSLRHDTNRNCSEFEEQSSHHGNCNEKNAEQVTNPINLADFSESWTFEQLCPLWNSDDHEMVEQNAVVREPNQLSPNFNVSSTEPMDNQNRIASDPSTSIFVTTEARLDHQIQVQAPSPNTSNHSTIVPENIDSNNIFEGLTDLNPEDLHANHSFTRSYENGTIWGNLPSDENKSNCWDW